MTARSVLLNRTSAPVNGVDPALSHIRFANMLPRCSFRFAE